MKVEVMLWMLVLVSVALAVAITQVSCAELNGRWNYHCGYCGIVVLTKRGERQTSGAAGITVQASPQQPKHVDFERFHIENLDENDPEAKNRIAVTEIRFDQIRPEAGSQPGTIGLVAARLYNDSPHFNLSDFAYYLVVQDCVKAGCTVIYDQRGWAPASVPANQARDIIVAIRDGDTRGVPTFKVMGTASIKLSATDTRSYQSARTPGL